jgi:5-methylcytosine-specific restriction protein A
MPTAPKTFRPAGQSTMRAPDRRGTRTERGYSNRWLKAAQGFLQRYPLCCGSDPQQDNGSIEAMQAACLQLTHADGCDRLASQVDHLVPVIDGQADPNFWDSGKWRGRSGSCHSVKTVKHDRHNRGMGAPPRGGS